MSEFRNKIYQIVSGQVPEYVEVKFPKFVKFLETYYRFLNESEQAHNILLGGENWTNIDKTLDIFLPLFRSQFAGDIPASALLDVRRLVKNIFQYYESKGSENATELFFRFMYNDDATVIYPGDYILRASDGKWSRKKYIKIDTELFPDENIFDFLGKKFSLSYLEFVPSVGVVQRTIESSCFNIIKQIEPNIYQLEVDVNPNYDFPDIVNQVVNYDIDGDGVAQTIASLGNYDTHIYAIFNNKVYGSVSKQIVAVKSVDLPGYNFRVDDAYIISEFGVEGKYFATNYVANKDYDVDEDYSAYVVETYDNNAIIRVKTVSPFKDLSPFYVQDDTPYFLEDYVERGGLRKGAGIDQIQLVRTGQRFLAREENTLSDVSYFDVVEDVEANYIYNPIFNTGPDDYASDVFELKPVNEFTIDLYPRFPRNLDVISGARITFLTGEIYHEPGSYKDSSGFLSDINKLHDNYYYQPYSYVIRSQQQFSTWKNVYSASNHPAGFKLFAELSIVDNLQFEHTIFDDFNVVLLYFDDILAIDDQLSFDLTIELPRSYFAEDYMVVNLDYVYEDNVNATEIVRDGSTELYVDDGYVDDGYAYEGGGVTTTTSTTSAPTTTTTAAVFGCPVVADYTLDFAGFTSTGELETFLNNQDGITPPVVLSYSINPPYGSLDTVNTFAGNPIVRVNNYTDHYGQVSFDAATMAFTDLTVMLRFRLPVFDVTSPMSNVGFDILDLFTRRGLVMLTVVDGRLMVVYRNNNTDPDTEIDVGAASLVMNRDVELIGRITYVDDNTFNVKYYLHDICTTPTLLWQGNIPSRHNQPLPSTTFFVYGGEYLWVNGGGTYTPTGEMLLYQVAADSDPTVFGITL